MKIYAQKFFQPFYELPANLPSNYLRTYIFTNYAFLLFGLLHFQAIFTFALLGVKILALYNIQVCLSGQLPFILILRAT